MNPAEFLSLAQSEDELWWFQGMRSILFDLLDSIPGKQPSDRVLEAGCGTGDTARRLNERYGWSIVATDIAAEAVWLARQSLHTRPVQADIAALPFPGESFDTLLCLDVLVHFETGDETKALAEFARVLRRGGLLVLRTSALEWLRSRHSQFTHERQRFSRRRLIQGVEEHGFRILRCSYANTLLLPVAVARFRIWEPLLRRPPASGTTPIHPWLNRVLRTVLDFEARLLRNTDLPLGQTLMLVAERKPDDLGCASRQVRTEAAKPLGLSTGTNVFSVKQQVNRTEDESSTALGPSLRYES
jgi:SAM-dependent methyltransferase